MPEKIHFDTNDLNRPATLHERSLLHIILCIPISVLIHISTLSRAINVDVLTSK